MSKEIEIFVNSRYFKYNEKTGKWDVKFFVNGKAKWARGFDTQSLADECTRSFEPKPKTN